MQSTNYLGLVTFNSTGISVANYNEIRSKLVEQFKLIYGSDIDLSTTSADGIYIETLSLIINNILQTLKAMYSNLDTRTATGQFLDILCALTNVTRKPATKSSVYVNITGLTANAPYLIGNQLELLDKNGNIWTCSPFTADASGETTILATCNDLGPVKAEVGWIYSTVEMLSGVTITMQSEAIQGTWAETDAQLRRRRENSLSMQSLTVLEGINGALLNVAGIEDVQIYNNDTTSALTAKDTTSIAKNDIYVLIRKNENITINDSIIGSIIYEKKTPGVHTTQVDNAAVVANNGIDKSYNYPNQLSLTQTVYWKECKAINPAIVIVLTPLNYFVSGTGDTSTGKKVANEVISYVNNLRISQDISFIELQSIVLFADPKYRGVSTYTISSITIDGASVSYVNPNTYFKYSTITITGDAPLNITITIV